MSLFELVVPALGESISEATIAKWVKANGEQVGPDDVVAELETDKATVELPAGKAGVLQIVEQKGATVAVGQVIAKIDVGAKAAASAAPAAGAPKAAETKTAPGGEVVFDLKKSGLDDLSPAVRALVVENKLQGAQIPATGPHGRLLKEDVLAFIENGKSGAGGAPIHDSDASAAAVSQKQLAPSGFLNTTGTTAVPNRAAGGGGAKAEAPSRPLGEGEEREEMSKLRQTIARRLVESQHNTASLTTYNEIDMSPVMALREKYKEGFEKKHGVGLGFMSFFAKAVIYALRAVPQVNWSVDGTSVIKRKGVHLGIAVSTEKGLMVPVLRDAQDMSMAKVESEIKRLAQKARDGKITVDDMAGGTFTVTNGGVFGSLLSTPIINPPQSGILGMHKIEKRAVVVTEGPPQGRMRL